MTARRATRKRIRPAAICNTSTGSTTVRAHVSAAGGKEGFINETLGRARGGFTSKIKPPAPEVFRARIRRVAGCATPTGAAGYAGVTADAIRR